jgi:hypothetical protein
MDKQHIVDEIRRTAQSNKGAPLGEMRFAKQTGIKSHDWKGRFWIRWSDALQEAGFQPNQWQAAYEDEVLFEKLIALIRELGHFPIKAEFQIKGHEDSSFPSIKAFDRLGPKHDKVAKLRAYCASRPEYADVVALCPAHSIEASDADSSETSAREEVFGFVYLLKSGRYYKIGHSNAVGRRERELAIQLPDKANTVHSIKTDDPSGIEDYWHRRFETKRKNGEWFQLDATDVKAFRRRTFM